MTEQAKQESKVDGRELDAVVAKMVCRYMQVQVYRHGGRGGPEYRQHKVALGAVCGSEGENKHFSDATPSGECWMQISDGRPAGDFFEPGEEYYVTFTRAPKKQ